MMLRDGSQFRLFDPLELDSENVVCVKFSSTKQTMNNMTFDYVTASGGTPTKGCFEPYFLTDQGQMLKVLL